MNICSYWKPQNFFLKKFINLTEKYFYFVFSYIQNFLLKKKLKNNFTYYDLTIVFNGYYMNKQIIEYIKKEKSRKIINIQTDNIFLKKCIIKRYQFFRQNLHLVKIYKKEMVKNAKLIRVKFYFFLWI